MSKTLLLVAAGILVSKGVGTLFGYFLVSLLGLLLADYIYYVLGYVNRKRVMTWSYFANERRKKKLDQADEFFRKRGWVAVLAARFIPFIRAFIYLAAGLNRMHPAQFLLVDALSSSVFIITAIVAGYLLAENQELILRYVSEVELTLALIAALVVLLLVVSKLLPKNPR